MRRSLLSSWLPHSSSCPFRAFAHSALSRQDVGQTMETVNASDTIVAIATPLGEGGIGVVRLSGPAALAIAARVFRSASGSDPATFPSHTVHLGRAVEPES